MIFKNKDFKNIEIVYEHPFDKVIVKEYSSIEPCNILIRTIEYQKL